MAKKFGKLISRLGLPLVSVAVSAGAVSFVIGSPHGDTKQTNPGVQPGNSTTIVSDSSTAINATTSGKGSPAVGVGSNRNIPITSGEGSPAIGEARNSRFDMRRNTTNNNVRGPQHNVGTIHDNRNQPTTNCNGGHYNKSVCGNVNTMINN